MGFKIQAIGNAALQRELESIVENDPEIYKRASAIKKINSQEFLIVLAQSDPSPFIRAEATMRIENQEALARIIRTELNINVRLEAIKRVANQETLLELLHDKEQQVRELVVKKLDRSYQTILIKIARQEEAWLVRYAAVWKIDQAQQTALIEISKEDDNQEIRKSAVQKVIDQDVLLELIFNDPSEKVKLAALKNLNSNYCGKVVAKKNLSSKLREFATSKIIDQAVLREISLGDSGRWVRDTAINNLEPLDENLETLRYASCFDKDENVRYRAVKKINNNSILSQVVSKSDFIDSKKGAIERISDIDELVTLRLTAHHEVQEIIRSRINELLENNPQRTLP
ncbi:MAG: HEAT repeat domain-containing protein [Candidatus Heimdallarchaeota archaeon]|nr:HEAT repeat domain-containing protein [Candidatus Heimdallarchaeota archaeon]